MRRRGITGDEIDQALSNIRQHYSTPQDSTCIVGTTHAGRVLKIWIVGSDWPPNEPLIIKSAAGKGEEDD